MSAKKQNDQLDFSFYAGYLSAKKELTETPANSISGKEQAGTLSNDAASEVTGETDGLKMIRPDDMSQHQKFSEASMSYHTADVDTSFILKQIVENSPDLIFSVNINYKLISANRSCLEAFYRIFGIELKIGQSILAQLSRFESAQQQLKSALSHVFNDDTFCIEMPLSSNKVGAPVYEAQFSPMKNANDTVMGASCLLRNVNKRVLERETLKFVAHHDAATRLLNQRAFIMELESEIRALRNEPSEHTLLFIGIDNFKQLKEECGYDAADRCAQRLSMTLRKFVTKNDIVARMGADEFAILSKDVSKLQAIEKANHIREAVSKFKFTWKKRQYKLCSAVGLSSVNWKTLDATSAIERADLACYAARSEKYAACGKIYFNPHS